MIAAGASETPLDIPEQMLIDAYKRYGALLLRGFAIDFAGFRALTDRYCSTSVFNESPGREVLDDALNIQTVNIGKDAFPLHPELSREPWKPDIAFFWCMNAPSVGGETTACDGIEIVKRLPPAVREAFRTRRLRYTREMAPAVRQFWFGTPEPDDAMLSHPPPGCPFEFGRSRGMVLQTFTRPALHKPMFADELAFGNYLMFGRYLKGSRNFPTFDNGQVVPDDLLAVVKEVSDGLTAPIDWISGDIAILDNTRFMHGRNRIIDVAERRIATYFGYLKFAIPDPEEGPDPLWRKPGFRPPMRD
jgi:alpha-ketoglutarate-dependent taurine dioxygenase